MKKFFYTFFILFLIFICLLVNKVRAYEFIKDINNPLTINLKDGYTRTLQAHIFKKNNEFFGILSARKDSDNFFSLILIKSSDGLSWTMEKEILRTGEELSNPRYIETVNNKLFFTRLDSDNKYRIYLADCDNEFYCVSAFKPLLTIDSNDPAQQNGMFAAFPFIQDDRVYIFYGIWGGSSFNIRLAYSDDWVNWTKCPNNNLINQGDGPFAYIENNYLNLFYHRSDSGGIKLAQTELPLNCSSEFKDIGYQLVKNQPYDSQHIFFPSIININDGLILYYTGRGQNNENRLNRAFTSELLPTITPTITPTLIPSLTMIPTATPTQLKTPIVIIPGFMASWNKEAILYNKNVDQSQWEMLSFVKEYDGLIKSLENMGYVKNTDFFIFNYDWRKPVLEIVDDFRTFITNHLPLITNHYSIVGHSLGGLVGRAYQSKYKDNNLNKLITIGSPHKGVSQVYKVIEAGEIEKDNTFFWLAIKIVLNLNRNKLEKDKDVINRLFPVLKDLFPIYNFLKKDGAEVDIDSMTIKNTLLSQIDDVDLISIVGEKGSTLKGFNVSKPSLTDNLFGLYPDGRPVSSFFDNGDYVVLSMSAKIEPSNILNFNHGEIVYKKNAIKKILDLLNIRYSDSQIIEGKPTKLDKSIIFLIKSKGKMEVKSNFDKFSEKNGAILIENPKPGKYLVNVKGIKEENDEIYLFRIYKNKESWEKIGKKNSPNHVNTYEVDY